MKPNFLKNIPKKKIKDSQMCWAASLAMLVPNLRVNQKKLLDKINEYNTDGLSYTGMPSEKDYYSKLLSEKVLNSIGGEQFQQLKFPNLEFIKKQINDGYPILIGGIMYPLFSGGPAYHSIVIVGYFECNDVFWVFLFDPKNKKNTYSVSWIYNELVFFHEKYNTEKLRIDIVTNIGKTNGKIFFHKDTLDFFNYESTKEGKTFYANDYKQESKITDYIQDFKGQMLSEFFHVDYELIDEMDSAVEKVIPQFQYNHNAFIRDDYKERYLYFPVFNKKDKVVLEFIYFNDKDRIKLLAIHQTRGFQAIKYAKRYNTNDKIKLNHKQPNYMLCSMPEPIKDIYLVVNEHLFVPLVNYLNLKSGVAYTYSEIKTLNNTIATFN